MRASPLLALLLTVAAAPSIGAAETDKPAGRRIALDEAERLALHSNPSLQAVSARVKSGELAARATISRMGPSFALSEEFQVWDSPFVINFPNFTDPSGPPTAFTGRDQTTNTFALAAQQPLLGLVRLVEEYRAQRQTAAATKAQLQVAQQAVLQGIRTAYLRHFEAKALEEIAQQSEKELSEQVTIAQAKLKAGVLTNADVLRVQVAVANAQQQEIVGRTQADIARASILITLGISPDEAVELVEPTALIQTSRTELGNYKSSIERALTTRPELLTARLSIETAQHQQRARLLSILPDVNLEAGYTRIDGQVFAPKNAAFLGVKATWAFWDWGATWFGYRAAKAQSEAATQDLAAQQRQISSEVASELAQSKSARSAVRLAEQSIESAAEAYRVTEALVKAGSATTTDLLESQAALSQARLNLVRAQYQMAIAYVAVQHAMGL